MNTPNGTISLPAEAAEFFAILTHDDRNSNYIIAKASNERWSERAVSVKDLPSVILSGKSSYYMTRNGFNGRKREANRCRQINALMFDIDCHGKGHSTAVPKLVNCLQTAIFNATLPYPNLFVDTGRGVQIYYVFDRSTPMRVRGGGFNEDGVKFVRDVESALANLIAGIVKSVRTAKLDTSVFDFSRVGRIPGTYNAKAGKMCSLLYSSDDYYTLADLKKYCRVRKEARKPLRRKMSCDRMVESRLRLVENLQQFRNFDCAGSRENMCFVHYNCATQLYGPAGAYEVTLAFNRSFNRPLPESDIASIKRTIDNVVVAYGPHKGEKGFYPLKTATLIDKLFMTPEEISILGVYSPNRKMQREEAKRATKRKRADRDRRICSLYAKGYKQRDIAKRVRCSIRTVSTVVTRENITKGDLHETVKNQFEQALSMKHLGSGRSTVQVRNFLANELGGVCVFPSPSLLFSASFLWQITRMRE